MNTLFMRLEGPLQSWGIRGRWGERDTMLEPTKSGVIGIIACALGWGMDRDDEIRMLSRSLQFGVRIDRPGQLLTDYHTVFGGVRSADGKIKITATTKQRETVVSHRFYLCDASFLAALQGPEEIIVQMSTALQAPVWPPFLGRRSCPPAVPFWAGIGQFDSLRTALASQPLSGDGSAKELRAVIEQTIGHGIRRNDEIDALSLRTYRPRYAADEILQLSANEEES